MDVEKYKDEFNKSAGYMGKNLSEMDGYNVLINEENNLVVKISDAKEDPDIMVDADEVSKEEIVEEWEVLVRELLENIKDVRYDYEDNTYDLILIPKQGQGKEHGSKIKPV